MHAPKSARVQSGGKHIAAVVLLLAGLMEGLFGVGLLIAGSNVIPFTMHGSILAFSKWGSLVGTASAFASAIFVSRNKIGAGIFFAGLSFFVPPFNLISGVGAILVWRHSKIEPAYPGTS
jgi:hypothetical protein